MVKDRDNKMKNSTNVEYYDKKSMYLPSRNRMALKMSTLGPVSKISTLGPVPEKTLM